MNPFNIHETDLGSALSKVPTGETPFIRFFGMKRGLVWWPKFSLSRNIISDRREIRFNLNPRERLFLYKQNLVCSRGDAE